MIRPPTEVRVQLRFFAAAKAVTGVAAESFPAGPDASIASVLDAVARRSADPVAAARVFGRCSFLLNTRAVTDPATELHDGDTLDVLPPFAGG